MALDGHPERAADRLERLDELAVRPGRERRRHEPGRKALAAHALVVVAVHGEDATADVRRVEDAGEPRPGGGPQRVGERVAVPPAGSGMAIDVLPQPAAREHVHRLEPAADPEHRQAAGLGRVPRRRLEHVALALHAVGPVDRLPIAGRVDVGAAAEQEAVHRREGRLALGP